MEHYYLFFLRCLLLLSLFIYPFALCEVTVTLPLGKLLGKTEVTRTNYTFNSFSGVRYAQPPLGNLRFKEPQAVEPWSDVYNATYEKNICFQTTGNSNLENEDCLFLNIYSPNLSPIMTIFMVDTTHIYIENKMYPTNISTMPISIMTPACRCLKVSENTLLPVMFFIHGGGFVMGWSGRFGRFGPDFFMEYDVVLVTINYRLGPFGFSATGDTVIPGNAGLKDQTLALKWVQQNIKYFGGDPSKVTIFGESAGSASVSYHLLSPKSAGLFRAAILESGSALSPWAYQRDQRAYTFETASLIDPNFVKTNNSEDLLGHLLNATARQIDGASEIIYNRQSAGNMQLQQGFYYAPVVEVEHEDAFITREMFDSFKNGLVNNVPAIIGINAEECIGQYGRNFQNVTDAFDYNETLLLPRNMHIDDSNPNKGAAIKAIQDFYGISADRSYKEQIVPAIRYLTDTCFARASIKQAELQSKFGDVYFYVLSYDGVLGDYTGAVAGTGNITHGEDLNYLFSRNLKNSGLDNTILSQFPASDVVTHHRMMKLWTNFGKYLDPTPELDPLLENIAWPKVNGSCKNLQYLDINSELTIKSNPRKEAVVFWDGLYEKYAVPPLDGY